jgi:arylsulfatase A-like enzyme|tara:strand:+ start:420 stop:1928 length:1509 start_codon:yes stop_codon:yes gene_type:complete
MMKSFISFICVLTLISATAFAADKPNVVIIYGDDVGYGDVGVYGSKKIPTPNIDKLASEGLVFTDGHCTSATCSPSRFSLLTGQQGFRNRVRILGPTARMCINVKTYTLPRVFKDAGYKTAVVGKWHLGLGAKGEEVDWNGEVKPGPLELGFDYSFLLPNTNDRVPCVYLENYKVVNLDPKDPIFVGNLKNADPKSTVYPNGGKDRAAMTYYQSSHGHNNSVINGIGRIGFMAGGKAALWDDETMADVFVENANAFIAKNKDKPFFLYFSSQDIHVPRTPHPRFKGKSELGYRGDAMVQFDWSTGEIMKTLKKHGLEDNTIVIFSSDNGPVYDDGYKDGTTVKPRGGEIDRGHDGSGPYRGGKYQIYEGGTRVPFIVRWPAKIKPGKSAALVSQVDFLASFAALLEVKLPEGSAMDSQNSLKALLGQDKVGDKFIIEEANGVALRMGKWKMLPKGKKGGDQLFDLETDIGEKTNVADKNPEVVKTMIDFLAGAKKKGMRHHK